MSLRNFGDKISVGYTKAENALVRRIARVMRKIENKSLSVAAAAAKRDMTVCEYGNDRAVQRISRAAEKIPTSVLFIAAAAVAFGTWKLGTVIESYQRPASVLMLPVEILFGTAATIGLAGPAIGRIARHFRKSPKTPKPMPLL
jgi:hypothetical protein